MQIRSATPNDKGFVFETFLRSIRAASTHVEELSNSQIVGLLSGLLSKGWSCNVADAEGYLAGWIVFANRNHMAWIYVRDMFRFSNYKDHAVCDMLLESSKVNDEEKIITPFLPNRNKVKWRLVHRPFLVI